MIPAFHDYSLEPKITKCGDLLTYKLSCLIAKTSFFKSNVAINLKKKSLQIAQLLWQFKEARTEKKKSWLFGTYLWTCLLHEQHGMLRATFLEEQRSPRRCAFARYAMSNPQGALCIFFVFWVILNLGPLSS